MVSETVTVRSLEKDHANHLRACSEFLKDEAGFRSNYGRSITYTCLVALRATCFFQPFTYSILKQICNWYSRNEKETRIDIRTYQMEIIKKNDRVSFHFPGKTKMAKDHFRCEPFDPLLRVTLASNFCVSVLFSFRRTKQRGEESE